MTHNVGMDNGRASFFDEMPHPPANLERLIWTWDCILEKVFPSHNEKTDGTKADERISELSGVDIDKVATVRLTRNRCCHPVYRGWPTQDQLANALGSSRDIWLGLHPKKDTSTTLTDLDRLLNAFKDFFAAEQ